VPELPETETIARDLDRAIAGSRIIDVRVKRADVLREVDARQLRRRVVGVAIDHAWRRAKLIVLDLSSSDRIVVQPRFTGALLIDDGALPENERRYSTVEFVLEDARSLHYRDIRRLGTVSVMDERRFARYSDGLGDEPLGLGLYRRTTIGHSSGVPTGGQAGIDGPTSTRWSGQHLRKRSALAGQDRPVSAGSDSVAGRCHALAH
jgi:formamidopyrimidine-DNA glycosylase